MHHKRHTVPNQTYASFPFYHREEIELKTNNGNQTSSSNDSNDPNEIEFAMQDKLKMCFSEMQNIKEQFDKRRKRFPSVKKKPTIVTQQQSTNTTSSESTSKATTNFPAPNVDNDGSKFKAHLIRTRSKDSIDDDQDDSVHPAFVRTTDRPRRSISDPFVVFDSQSQKSKPINLQSTIENSNSNRLPTFQSMRTVEPTKKQQGFNEWLSKLEEINDMSRSTIDRIRRLENDIFALRNSTTTNVETPVKTLRIPINQMSNAQPSYVPPPSNKIRKRSLDLQDKAQNTDIDMEFMDKLLKYWQTYNSVDSNTNANQAQQHRRHTPRDPIRRLTTTISRSVKLQTDSEGKSFAEKEVMTDADYSTAVGHHSTIDLPIVNEKPFIAKSVNTFHICSDNKQSIDLDSAIYVPNLSQFQSQNSEQFSDRITPEPIVEMYSDDEDDQDANDDSYFDDFEKDIFREMNRRAMIRNRIKSRSAQTVLPPKMTDNAEPAAKTIPPLNSSSHSGEKQLMVDKKTINNPQKQMHSTSKIIIERKMATSDGRIDKREVIIKTDIGHDGKVYRTTEIRNGKEASMDMIKIENECYPPVFMPNDDIVDQRPDSQLTENSKPIINVPPPKLNAAESKFTRTQSAFDFLSDANNDLIHGKTDQDFLSNKAFSSLDISSDSQRPQAKSPVMSEGYHSEQRIDSSHQNIPIDNSQRMNDKQDDYLIEPPESFESPKVWVMNNETLIENIGNQMNITNKASSSRKPPARNESDSNLIDFTSDNPPPLEGSSGQTTARTNNENVNECRFSIICNNQSTNIVFRADFGLSKLPMYETNL